ncbi:hypothetical protein Ancab_018977 [Ancistrocladus abbreviatus]
MIGPRSSSECPKRSIPLLVFLSSMESGFSSPRPEAFPAGLRVLVVDDDLTWLKILEKMLKKCNYEVTTCGLAREALKLLREKKDGFDIVISDVNMPDMDGFKLLEHVGLEMDLPVIMMSVDGETSRVMKGVQHGACDYLLKPIRMKELRNIWQHVYRKRMHEVRDIESHDSIDDIQIFRNGIDHSENGHVLSGGDQTLLKKRKDVESKHDDKDSDPSASKKPRVVWSIDLHQKFVKAVHQIGLDKVGPKKILDLMNVPGLTRENVASHLQKYRLYLSRLQKEDQSTSSRLQKENHSKPACGLLKSSDQSPKDSSGSFGLQSCTIVQQSDAAATNFRYDGNKLPVQTVDSNEFNLKDSNLSPLTDTTKPFNADMSPAHKASSSLTMLNCSFGSLEPGINRAAFDSPINSQCPWSAEAPDVQLRHGYNVHHHFGICFNNSAVHMPKQIIPDDLLQPSSINPGHSICESDKQDVIEVKPLKTKHGNKDLRESYSLADKAHQFNLQLLGPITYTPSDVKDERTSHNSSSTLESDGRNQISEIEFAFGCFSEDLMFHWLQGDNLTTNLGFDLGFLDPYSLETVTEVPFHIYGEPKFDYEYFGDLD